METLSAIEVIKIKIVHHPDDSTNICRWKMQEKYDTSSMMLPTLSVPPRATVFM